MNVFGVIIGRKSSSQQEEQTPSSSPLASPQSSPLPAGRAGRLQRQNATLSNNTRYNARSTPGTPDRARATSRHSGEGSSSSAYSTGPASSSRAVLVRQGGNREHSQLAQFHEMMQVSPKISRNDPLPETPESIPRRLQEKMDTVNLPELEKLDGGLYEYAKMAIERVNEKKGADKQLSELDKKMLPLFAEAENARHPDLNLHVFRGPEACYKAIKEQNKKAWDSRQPMNMRVVFSPSRGIPDHHVALDVQLRPGHHPSVVCFESALWGMMNEIRQDIEHGLKESKVKLIGNFVQASDWDCAMFALSNALKLYKHHDEYTSRLHAGEEEENVRIPSEFIKHAQSKGHAERQGRRNDIVTKDKGGLHAETLLHRNLAYCAQRFDKAYSTSIEGFRFQEIQRAGDYLAAQRGRK